MADHESRLAALKLIAAQSAKLARDLELGRLWEGEYERAVAQIEAAMRDVRRG